MRDFFKLQELGTDVRTEVKAGATTFMTMAYIIFVQPAVLSSTGMDFNSVFIAVCLASAGATILMGLYANYPIGLAPAMGHNFFFAYTVVLIMGVPWQTVLGAVFVSGSIFIATSFFGMRERVIDAVGTVAGATLGTSTITSYIESAAGVAEGGRSGLSNVVTALFFIAAIFFSPLIRMIGGGYQVSENLTLYPVTAPALIIVGSIMLKNVVHINWRDYTESIPAFLALIIMPLTFSITEGIAFGFISYSLLKLLSGRAREVHWMIYLFGSLFVLRYIFLAS